MSMKLRADMKPPCWGRYDPRFRLCASETLCPHREVCKHYTEGSTEEED